MINRSCLLLNASYEPLGVVSVPRAVRLIFINKAKMVEQDGDKMLHTPSAEYPMPSVIRLIEYVDVFKRRKQGNLRTRIILRDGGKCQYCGVGGKPHELTLDHILPRSRGGKTEPSNLATACKPCNQRKGDRTPKECKMTLRSNPSALMYDLDKALLINMAKKRPEWQPYIYGAEVESEEVA